MRSPAPESPFPGPLDDCYEGLRWVFDNAEHLGVDRSRIGIGAVHVGNYDPAGQLYYAGGVGSGFDNKGCAIENTRSVRHRRYGTTPARCQVQQIESVE